MNEPIEQETIDAIVSRPRRRRRLGVALVQFALVVATVVGWVELSRGGGALLWFLLPFASLAALSWFTDRRETHENVRLQIDAQGVRAGERLVLTGQHNEAVFVLQHESEQTMLVAFDPHGALRFCARFAPMSPQDLTRRLYSLRPFLQGDRGAMHASPYGTVRWGDLGLRVNQRFGTSFIQWSDVDEIRVARNGVRIDFLFDSITFSVNAVPEPFRRALHAQLAALFRERAQEGPGRALLRASVREKVARNGRSVEQWHEALRSLAQSEHERDPYRSAEGMSVALVEAIVDDPSEPDDAREGAVIVLAQLRSARVTGVRVATEAAEAQPSVESERPPDASAARGRDG